MIDVIFLLSFVLAKVYSLYAIHRCQEPRNCPQGKGRLAHRGEDILSIEIDYRGKEELRDGKVELRAMS